MKALLPALCLALACLAAPAHAQVVVESPFIGGPGWRPYGPGFSQGVVVGPRDGCRNFNCPRGEYQNRPFHRRYYDRYFDVPTPGYSRPRALGGNRAFAGSHLSHTRPATETAARHREWCVERYRSYRASDNSFQPFEGPRRQCVSPYS